MKRYRLKKEVKNTLIILFLMFILGICFYIIDKMDEDFIESCTKAGYSVEHCIKNK